VATSTAAGAPWRSLAGREPVLVATYGLGAGLLAGQAAVHGQQYVSIFHGVRWIGPLFLGDAAASVAAIAGLAFGRSRQLAALIGVVISVGVLGGLVVSYGQGLFGWQEAGFRTPVELAVITKVGATIFRAAALAVSATSPREAAGPTAGGTEGSTDTISNPTANPATNPAIIDFWTEWRGPRWDGETHAKGGVTRPPDPGEHLRPRPDDHRRSPRTAGRVPDMSAIEAVKEEPKPAPVWHAADGTTIGVHQIERPPDLFAPTAMIVAQRQTRPPNQRPRPQHAGGSLTGGPR
jgi:hypothetical protein